MNKIYKVVWNAARGCYVVASELVKTHQGKKSTRRGGNILSRIGTALLLAIAGWGAACNFIYADVTVADSGKVDKTKLADGGIQYDIYNQQVNKGSALNKFTDFGIGQKDVANLQLDKVDRQINLVKNRINIEGVVNAIKDNKIGGDVYFFSDAGIAVGATGVFNVGRLTLGTNAAYGEALYNGGMEKHLAQSAASQAKAVAGGSDITLQGKVYAQGDVVLGAGSLNVKDGEIEIRTHRNNADTYADKKAAEAYRNQLVNVSPSATVAKALGHGDIALAAVGVSSAATPFETKGAIVIDQAYMDAAGGDTSVIASAERNGGNLMGSKADASVEISNATIQGKDVTISAETKVTGNVGSADAYKTGAEEDGILGLLHATFDEQVGSLASVVKTGADSRVTVKDSQLTAANDLTISSKAESEIGSETGGALGVGINVGIAGVSSKVDIQGTKSVLTAGKDLAISAEGSNAIDLQRQGSAEDLPIAIDLGWAEAKTDASVTVAKEATLKAKEKVDVSAKAERNLSVEVENSSGDGTLGLAVGVIQSETKATADVQGKVYADGKVSVSAENTVSDENGKYDPDTLHITSESESDDGTSSDPIHDIVDVATTKGKGNQLMAGIKKLWGDKSTEKKAADAETAAADQTAATSAGGGLGLNAATAFLFSDNSAKASLAGEVRGYDGNAGTGAVDVHAETLSRTKVKAGVSQGADKSAGIAAAVNYVDQNDKAEAELSGDIKSKGDVKVSAETKRPWQSNLEGFGENLKNDLATIFDPNDGFELSYLTDSWTQTGGAGEKVSGAAALNIMEYNHTAKATVKKGTKVDIDNGNLDVSAKNDIHTVNFSGDIKAPIGDQPGSLDFWEDIEGSPFSGGGKAALGGAALTVHQKNTAEATVEDGVTVTNAKDVSVTAENKGWNLSIAGAGGKGQTVAIDGTVNVNRFENTTKATVGKATINADGDVSVNAEDNSKTINIGGAIAVSGQAGIGATVAYNHIDRQTEASLQGKVTSTKDVSVTAKNTGAIYAMSAAGGITMESSPVNGAGSSGLHAQEGASGSGTSSIGDLAGTLLNAGKSEKDKKSIDSGDSALTDVANKDASMGENVGAAKGGFAAAANVSVNRITDTAKAYTKGSTVSADSLAIRSGNDSQITTGAGAIALGLSQNSQAIAGSFMYNAITDKNEAYAEDATLSLTGSKKDDTSLTVEADNAAKITNIAASGSGASKGSAVAGQISLNWVDNTTDAHVKGGSLKAGKAATISAKDRGTIDSYTGAVAISGGGNGAAVGASIAANLIEGDTKSYLENSKVAGTAEGEKAGKLSVTADETSEIQSIVAAGAGSGKLAAVFAASGNWIHTKTDAHISNANDMKTGALSVLAKNGSNATLGVGSAAVGGNSAGASIAVMVNQSEVKASLTGDANKEKTITADGITVKADNAYNGDASESDQKAKTAKTVAVGLAGGTSQFAGSGSVTVNVIDQTTDATIGKGKYDAGQKAAQVAATSTAKLFGLAGGASLSAGSGVGAAVDVQTYNGHTYAGIADGASLKNASFVTVNADSKEHLTSVAATFAGGAGSFAGAGAAGAHSISTDTKAYVGQSEVTEAGDVSVTAKDETKLNTVAGSVAGSANAGVGLTAAVEVVNKKASAIVGDDAEVTGRSLTVKAENTSSSETSATGLGAAGTAGLAGAASETFVTHTTDAHVGKNTKVSAVNGVDILAHSNFTQVATAGSVGGSTTAGMGLTNSTVSFTGDTAAYADEKAVIDGGKKVNISASQLTNVDYGTAAGAVGGTASLSGTVGVNVLKTTTKAYAAGSSQLSAKTADAEGIAVTASDETTLKGGNGGTSIGISGGGAGAAIGVTNISKDTEAFLGGRAAIDTAGKTKISAENKESLTNVTVQAAGGLYAGLAGAVNVTNLSAVTKAYTGDDVFFNQADKKGGDVTVEAKHNIDKMTSAVAGAAVGAGALGAAADIGTIRTQTNAFLGRNNKLHTDGALVIDAADHMDGISTNAIAAAVGGFGVAGSVSVYSFGSIMSDSDAAMLSGKTSKDGGESSMDDWVKGEINKSQTGNAMGVYQTNALTDVKNKLGTTFQSETPDMGEKGTLAQIGAGSEVSAGSVRVAADDKLAVSNIMGNVSAGGSAAGISVNVVRTDTLTQAKTGETSSIQSAGDVKISAASDHQMKSDIVGASLSGGISAQGTEETWMDKSIVRALAGTGSSITSGGQTAITSSNVRSLDAKLAGASVALSGALNGAVITAHVDGSSEAGMGDGASIDAKEEAKIDAEADTKLSAKAVGAALGIYAGTGTGVALSSEVAAKADVGNQTAIHGKNISITAKNTPTLEARAVSAGLGIAGVGRTISEAQSKDKALVRVGDNARLTADEALAIRARMDKPADAKDYNAYAQAIAGAGGVVSGAVGQAFVDMAQETKVSIGNSSGMTAKKATIAAEHDDTENVEMDSVSAGGVSGTGGETKVTVASDAGISIGRGSTITTAEETAIRAENVTEKAWRDGSDKKNEKNEKNEKNVSSIGAALASGNGVVNETSITHVTTVDLDAVTIKANASDLTVEEKAAGKTLYDKNAIAIDAASRVISKDRSTLSTGAAVGAAHVKNTNSVAATTTAHVGEGSQLLAGETEKAKEKDKTASYTGAAQSPYSSAYKGGSIAVGTRNDAELASDTLVDVYGAAGYAGSENRVTYTGLANTSFAGSAETAKGDISLAAGRDSAGETGTISVSAHSDILNATAIPISIQKDPYAKADSQANLTVTNSADMKSDRDILLKAKAGAVSAYGNGEVKDWVNKVAGALGADGSSIGRKEISSSADVTMDGKAETGIHRNKSITIGGQDNQGSWETTVKSDGDISYTYGGTTIVGKELSERLAALREKLADFGADDSTKAAYEAEIQFLEEKMAAQGLGYFETDDKGNKQFIELPSSDTSELEDAKKVLKNAKSQDQRITDGCKADQDKLDQQKTELTALGTEHTNYLGLQSLADAKKTEAATAKNIMEQAGSAKDIAEGNRNDAYATLEQKAGNQTVETYIQTYPSDESVMHYKKCSEAYETAVQTYNDAASAYSKVEEAVTDSQKAADASAKAYSDAVTKYNRDYSDTIDTDVTKYDSTAIDAKGEVIDQKKQASIDWQKQVAGNQELLANQISATEKFYANGGTDANGTFTKDGASVITVDANGNPVPEDTEGSYYLLHKNVYQQMTHNMKIDGITAQLGDILFEGDNVSGSGTLHAGGDASVSITNASPNTLTVGDIHVVGRGGIDGSGQGGTIFYNDVELKGDMKAAIEKENKDKSMNVGFAVKTRQDTAAPSITVKNTFQPSDYKDGDMPHYAASTTTLAGYIYNPRGSVTVESKNGDVYNDGTIYAGTVDMKVENGDFIQSLSDKKNSIFHVGGAPLDDTGKQNSQPGTGILANGNIFISARYVNINSKIQSGIADWDLTIPKDCKFYYEDTNGNKMYVQSKSDVPAGRTVRVEGATGRAAEKLSYDFDSGRFIVDDIEVHGGKVSIVGTIINTTNDKSKARIEALDGYGQISIRNDSGKDIELRTLSTGEGTEGRIELTDLDRGTGKIARKTTYTRDGGKIHMSVQNYQNGAPSGNAQDTVLAKGTDGTYTPVAGSYYTLQTGTDKSYTTTYELHKTKVDWWGIDNKTPTGQEVLDQGGTITDYKQGDTRTLNGGAIITTTNDLNGGPTGETYKKTTKTINNKTESIFTKKAKRLWYTVGLAKKFDYKLVEKKYDTTIHQYSQKADYDIGIRFIGDETGGKLNVNGGTGNVIVNGTISNGLGEATLSAGGIQQGARGYIDTNTLTMTATTGSAGTRDAAIKTNAMTVSGSAAKDFGVKVVNHGVTAGSITAGAAAIQAEGDISQQAGTEVHAGRVELASGGAIQGANGSFLIETGQSEGKDYGLKASAEGHISIENTSGDLYLDSVISKEGDVSLKTNGSFIDNNYTDLNDEDATAKLLGWAHAAVLEGSAATVEKQKTLLKAKVESKYNEYQSLAAYVKDGKYTLDETARAALEKNGVTDIDKYIAEKQKCYDALKDTVGTWKKADVEAYTKGIEDSTDKMLYGNAALTEKDLTADKYLTVEEKKEVLVGSAKSAKALLITFAPGSIKEGITDTNTMLKGTPHVSGKAVTLTAGEAAGSIGQKKEGMTIDLSDMTKLTREQLLALSAAERGDFNVQGNQVTVSSIRAIDAEAKGKLQATADKGAIYLVTEGSIAQGSTLSAMDEIRLKASDDITGVTLTSDQQVVLESGEGAIQGVELKGSGVLTARAKDGVDLKKSDGDLVINTVYASEGDVHLDVGKNSLLAEDGHDTSGDETGTTYTNIEGKNITIENANDIRGAGDKKSLGMKVTGAKAKDGSETPGVITAKAAGNADITLFGKAASDAIDIEAEEDLTLTSRGNISNGSYKARKALHVYNAKGGTISGGTFTGADTTLTNEADLSGAKVEGTTKLTVKNTASIQNATLTGGAATVDNNGENSVMKDVTLTGSAITLTNKGTVENGTYTAETGAMTIRNSGKLSSGTYTAKADAMGITNEGTIENGTFTAGGALTYDGSADSTVTETTMTGASVNITNAGTLTNDTYIAETGAMGITNEGTIKNGTFTARGDLTYTDSENASLSGSDFTSEEGNVKVTAKGQLALKKLSAKASATVEADRDVTLNEAEAGTLAISSGGSVNAGTLTATTGDAKITAKKDVTIGTLDVKEHAELTSGGDMVLHEAEAGGTLTADAGGSISVKGKDAKISAADITMHAGEDIRITDRSPVGKLHGVDTSTPAGSVTGSGAAGSLVTGEAKPHDFDASGKGSALLSSAGGKVTLSAKKVEIDTLKNGEGNAADLTISADNIGIDDLAGVGAQHVTIHGKDGQSQAHYAGIHSTAEGGTLVKDSKVEHLELTGREPLGLSNTAIGGDSLLATDKIRVTIQKNPGSSQAEHFGNLSLSGYDIVTDHVMTSVKDGLTVNGERFPVTAESVMNASLYEDRTLGRDGREKEEEAEKDSPSLAFGAPNEKESYEVVK